jgi:hypothetical protein
MRVKLIVAFVFLGAGASVLSMFLNYRSWESVDELAAEVSPLIFLAASAMIFFRPQLGYWLGLAAGLMAEPYFVRSEMDLAPFNSWLFLNCEIGSFETSCGPLFTRFRMLVFVFVPISIACAVLRLLPTRWMLRGSPFSQRLWPAFAVSSLGLAIWFAESASPYRLPMFHADNQSSRLRILHVEKHGFRFHETTVFEARDGIVSVARVDRRWFEYRSKVQFGMGVASSDLNQSAHAFIQAAKGWKLHTGSPRALWSWDAEGWYVVTPDRRFSFIGAPPPEEVRALFHELESVAPGQGTGWIRDICLGFCYDPPAALGLSSFEARSWLLRAR